MLLVALAAPNVGFGASVAAGAAHSAVVKDVDATVWSWGSNGSGRLGDNSTTQRSTPVQVGTSGNWLTSVTMVAAGAAHTLALKTNGTVVAWGSNADGQVGDNTTATQRLTPVAVVGITGTVVGIAAGDNHSLAWTSDGKLYSWGRNSNGQLGLGDTTLRRQATQVIVDGTPSLVITHAAAGSAHTLAVTSDSAAWAFGLNGSGRLGDGTTTQRTSAVHVRDGAGVAITGVSKVAAGGSHSLAIKTDATGLAWGLNSQGQLGDGSTTTQLNPVPIESLSSIAALSGGASHSIAIESDGTVHAWGDNTYGQLGDGGVTSSSPLPALVVGIEDAVTAVAASNHSIAVTSTGVVWVWGRNSNSQLGDGTTETRLSPVAISAANFEWKVATPTFSVASGTYTTTKSVVISCATPGSATIRYTLDGSNPNGSSTLYTGPVSITVSATLKARAFLAAKPDSNVGTAVYELKVVAPTVTPGSGTYATPQAPTMSTSTAGATIRYTTDGSEPTEASTAYPPAPNVDATLTLKAKAFLAGWTASDTTARVYTMKVGAPALSPSGGTYTSAQTVTVTTVTPNATLRYTTSGYEPVETDSIVSGGTVLVEHSVTLKVKGWKAGWNASDVTTASYLLNLGTVATPTFAPAGGSYTSSQTVSLNSATPGAIIRYTLDGSNPNPLSPIYGGPFVVSGTTTVKAQGFMADMAPSAVGSATYTINLGAVDIPSLSVPSGTYTTARSVIVSCSTSGATLYYTTNGAEPTQADNPIVSGGTLNVDRAMIVKVKAFHATLPASATARRDYLVIGAIAAGGLHSLAVKTDGTAWSFGSNIAGQIGDGTTTTRKTPYAVPGLGTVVGVAAGASHSLALVSDGSVKSWGLNTAGQLGDGTLTSPRKTPVSVTGLAGTVVVALAAGDAHTLALTSAGTVLAWGSNASGQLGIGPTPTQSSTPVLVSGLTGVVAIAAHTNHSLALKANGSVVAWGANNGGQLGDGTTTLRNTPVSVLAPSGLSRVAAGGNFSLAVLTHGSPAGVLWSWGQNNSGQLGDGTLNTPRKNPSGGLTDIVALEAGEFHTLVMLADGSLWGWGPNANGQIGDGSNTWRLFPTRLPAAPETLELDAGDTHSLALASNGQLWAWGGNGGGQLGDGTLATKYSPSQVPGFELASNAWLASDTDQDGLTNAAEYRLGTDPLNPDSNGNGIPDGLEVQLGKSPTDPDSDGDGLGNSAERAIGTDPFNPDTDGDGALDGADCFPLDPTLQCPQPVPGDTTPATITLTEPTNAVQVP